MTQSVEDDESCLQPVGAGEQGFVYGTDRWVVKIWRCSPFSLLAKWITRPSWQRELRESLGGLVAPFLLLEDVCFEAPKMTGRGRVVRFRRRRAIARERYPVGDFLDHRLSLAAPEQALALVEEMVELVGRVRARGFYMHDFIMKNFVVVDGRLVIADTGLIVPVRSFWELGMRISAWGFWRGLSRDYQRLLGELLDELGEGDPLRERIGAFRSALPARLKRLRDRSTRLQTEPAQAVEFDPGLEKAIRAAVQSGR